eukprot:9211789-Lingulodinium_polyedra.AAC.1
MAKTEFLNHVVGGRPALPQPAGKRLVYVRPHRLKQLGVPLDTNRGNTAFVRGKWRAWARNLAR